MNKIRINELARDLEVKASTVLEMLPELGVEEKKTHSSSVDEDVALEIRRRILGPQGDQPANPRLKAKAGVKAAGKPDTTEEGSETSSPEVTNPIMSDKPGSAVLSPPKVEKFKGSPTLDVVEETAPSRGGASPIRPPIGGGLQPPLATRKPVKPPMGATLRSAPSAEAAAEAPASEASPARPTLPPIPPTPGEADRPRSGLMRSILRPPVAKDAPEEREERPAARPSPTQPGQIVTPKPAPPPAPPPTAPTLTPGSPIAPRAMAPGAPLPRAPHPPERRMPPSAVVAPGPRPSQGRDLPGAPQPNRPLAGQPAARPVVPPRPDLVAKILKQRMGPGVRSPGQPSRGPVPGIPQPGQPIYRGPIRPGQPLVNRPGPGGPGFSPHARRGPGPAPLPAPSEPPKPADSRRPGDRRRQAARQREEEERTLLRRPRQQYEDTSRLAADKEIQISEGITVKELAEKLELKVSQIIKKLVEKKMFATINQSLDAQLAQDVAKEFGAKSTEMSYEEETVYETGQSEVEKDLQSRPPVVTVMGHVDHGKTSLLDALRESNVVDREAGGITQHIGAYKVVQDGKEVVFIDTPGHEAFTRMRARGARITDIVVLVVAADDGVMPQTLEAIDHAKAAKSPIVVAINKIDKPDANPDRVKQQLSDRGLVPEEWGGEVVMVPVSAKSKQNLDLLIEMILLVSEVQDLKANPDRPGEGVVLEAKLDRGRGPVATLLVRNGTLRVSDYFICGAVFGKVRALFNDRGEAVKEAGPATPIEVLGLENVPEVGDALQVVTDIAKAKQVVMFREIKAREQSLAKSPRLTLDTLHDQLRAGDVKELLVILKADVGGSAEVVAETLQKLSTEKVQIKVIHTGVGAITETDVLLASASEAIIVAFNVRPERNAAALAEQEGVDIRLHTIIYELTDEVKKAMVGLLEPVRKETYKGRAEVRNVFRITKVGQVAGSYVQDGEITRNSEIRVLRDNVVIHTGRIASLKRFKDDASSVKSGMECGIALHNFSDVKPGDILEAFITEEVPAEALT